jgi:transcriptional regulator with XRE-family HTH domain
MQLQSAIPISKCAYSPERLLSACQADTPRMGEDPVPTRPGPTVQRRRLGLELRQLREAAGKTIDDVAEVLECSDSKISRIENGQVSAAPRDVRDMLDFYGVAPERRDELVEVARAARKKGWWEAYTDTLVVPMVGLEVAADHIHAYEPMVVHGLLQTRDYAEAVIRAMRPNLPADQVERWVQFRMTRQELLSRDDPPNFEVVLEECALRRPVGGRDVMRAQLEHLVETYTLPKLTLQILPLGVGEHAAMSGAFMVYRFSEQLDPDVVYLEHTTSDLYIEAAEQVERYVVAFERVRAAALSSSDSSSMLAALIRELS